MNHCTNNIPIIASSADKTMIFKSLAECADYFKVSSGTIKYHMRNDIPLNVFYFDELPKDEENDNA